MEKRGAIAIGASADSVDKQARFRDKHQLNMPLLADTERRLAADYGVVRENALAGRPGTSLQRTTFIIGKDGLIRKIFRKVKVNGHIEEVLRALDSVDGRS